MAFSTFLSGVRLLSHILAYSPAANPLAKTLHLRPGSKDIWVPVSGTIDRRPGIRRIGNDPGANVRTRHVVVAEDGSLAASVYHTGTQLYQVWYKNLDANWLRMPSRRGINNSVSPHEMLWVGRKLYVKGNPTSDRIGAVVFDLDQQARADWWGLLRPSAAPTFAPTGDWLDSGTDRVEPLFGARYAYTFISSTGHESSVSDFTDRSAKINSKYPRLVFPQESDDDDIPYFRVYRSPDGGGRLYFVEDIENTGQEITWDDTNFEEGGNFSSGINFSRLAPGPDTNDPPPTVESGEIGVDPIERCTPIVEWGGRIIFGVGKNLYYSVNDEAVPGSGVLQESFRGGSILRPNRATFRENILDVLTSTHGVYIFTTKNTYIMTGERRSEIRFRQIYPDIGIHDRHCSTAVGGHVIWLDQNLDLRSAEAGLRSEGTIPAILSSPLKGEQAPENPDNYYIRVDTHHIVGYLLVSIFIAEQGGTKLTPIPQDNDAKVFVFDAVRKFWFAPWFIRATTIWERFHVVNSDDVGRLDAKVHEDFGDDFAGTIVTSASLVIGEADLNVTDADFGFQSAEGVEFTWIGSDLVANNVKIGVEVIDDLALFTACNRGDGVIQIPQGMTLGKFWLPAVQASGRYFAISIDIPRDSNPWSLLNALFIFSKPLSEADR